VNPQYKRGILGVFAASVAIGAAGAVIVTRSGAAQYPKTGNIPGAVSGTIAARQPGAVGPIDGALTPSAEAAQPKPKPANAEDNAKIARFVSQMLVSSHYSRHPFDDEMSARFLDMLLDNLDPQHLYFLQSDIAEFDKYRTQLDDLTLKGDISPADVIIGRFKERVQQNTAYAAAELKSEKFDFTTSDTILIDRKKEPRPVSLDDAKKLWLNRLRFEYLQEKLGPQAGRDFDYPPEALQPSGARHPRVGQR